MMFVIVLVLLLLCMVLTLKFYEIYWKKGLSTQVRFDCSQLSEGESCHIEEKVENRKWLPLPALNVKFQLDRSVTYKQKENTSKTDKQYRSDCLSMMPYQRVTRTFDVTFEKRGLFEIGKVNLVAVDLFFTEMLVTDVENESWIYVFPKRSDLYQVKAEFDTILGEMITNRFLFEDPFAFKGIRAYAPTDPMKRINWKSSAKTGDLKVNQFYDTSSQQVTIFLNLDQEGIFMQEQLLEESIRVTRNYLEWFQKAGIEVCVYSNGIDMASKEPVVIQKGVGAGHLENCLKQLARLDYCEGVEPMENLLLRVKEKEPGVADGMTVLLSVNQSDSVAKAFDDFVGENGTGRMLIPVYPDGIRKQEDPSAALSHMKHARVLYLKYGRS